MNITLTHLATATLKLGTPAYLPNTPRGIRAIVDVVSAQWEGERLKATLKPVAAADWALFTPDGTLHIDVRCTLETHDGALIHVTYTGRASVGPESTSPIIIAVTFETGDSRYTWLNQVQAIGRGIKGENNTLIYDIYQAS
jgi:hypothetical protein